MGILLGLATALSWGSADLCARFGTRTAGTFRTMLYMQLSGFAMLSLVMPLLGGWPAAAGRDAWAWGILAGCLNTGATLALYRSFEIGKMSVVAPVSASYPVLTMLLSVLTGERLTMLRLLGLTVTILGVVLVARGEKDPPPGLAGSERKAATAKHQGVGWALLAALGYGVMFWLLGVRTVPLLGAAQSVWVIRMTSVLATTLIVSLARQSLALPPRGSGRWIVGAGFLDTGAYLLNNFGMRMEQISVVSVLASLYGAVTVLLATLFLKEPVSRMQWCGIGSIFLGIVCISR